MSVDHMSIYSTATLVGGGEEEIRAEEQRQRLLAERAFLARRSQHRASNRSSQRASTSDLSASASVDFHSIANRVVGGAPLTRQSSIETLYVQPTRPLPALSNRRLSQTPATAPQTDDPDSDSAQDHDTTQSLPRLPWWSPMVPNPPIGTSSGLPTNLNRNRPTRSMSDPDSDQISATDYGNASVDSPFSTNSARAHQSMPPLRQSSSLSDFRSMLTTTSSRRHTTQESAPAETLIPPSPPVLPQHYRLYTKCYCEENAYLLAAYLSRICRYRNELKSTRLRWDVDVVFVSNKDRMVALWQQKAGASAESDYQVVWDYHVFVILSCQRESTSKEGKERTKSLPARHASIPRRRSAMSRIEEEEGGSASIIVSSTTTTDKKPLQSWVYDLDSRITSPAPLAEYISSTFGLDNGLGANVNKRFRPLFRVIPGNTYFTRFGSDRSHMKKRKSSTDPSSFDWTSPRPSWDLLMGKKASSLSSYFMDSFVDMRVRVGDGRFGRVVKMNELVEGSCLMMGKIESEQTSLAPGVAVLLDNMDDQLRQGQGERSSESQFVPTDSQDGAIASITSAMKDEEEPNSPGSIIGGIQRYGMRPPPPPPDGAIIPTASRGKRIMDPMYPAYIASVFEHLAA